MSILVQSVFMHYMQARIIIFTGAGDKLAYMYSVQSLYMYRGLQPPPPPPLAKSYWRNNTKPVGFWGLQAPISPTFMNFMC